MSGSGVLWACALLLGVFTTRSETDHYSRRYACVWTARTVWFPCNRLPVAGARFQFPISQLPPSFVLFGSRKRCAFVIKAPGRDLLPDVLNLS